MLDLSGYRKLIISFIGKTFPDEDIVFVAAQGGLARGTCSEDSDIDIVIATEDVIFGERYYLFEGRIFEIRYLPLSRVRECSEWLERTRYIYVNETLFVLGNYERFSEIVNECRMTEKERKDIFAYCIKRCGVRGIIPSPYFLGRIWKNRVDYWEQRGDILSQKYFLSSGIDYLITLVYALNHEFTPSPKYRIHNIRKLENVPMSFWNLIDDRYNKDLYITVIQEIVEMFGNEILREIGSIENYSVASYLPMFEENRDF